MEWRCLARPPRLVTAPAVEPVTPTELREHARIDDNDEDMTLATFIKAARMYIEKRRSCAFVTQTWAVKADAFPDGGIELWPVPVIAISSVQYVDENGTTQTWGSSNYTVDTTSYPARLLPAYGVTWPTTQPINNALTVTFTAGYGATAAYVPDTAKLAIRLLAGDFIENREATQAGTFGPLPMGLEAMISTFGIEGYR